MLLFLHINRQTVGWTDSQLDILLDKYLYGNNTRFYNDFLYIFLIIDRLHSFYCLQFIFRVLNNFSQKQKKSLFCVFYLVSFFAEFQILFPNLFFYILIVLLLLLLLLEPIQVETFKLTQGRCSLIQLPRIEYAKTEILLKY